MPNITLKELRIVDRYITKLCKMLPTDKMSEEDKEKEIQDYYEVSSILGGLYKKNDEITQKNKKIMQRLRAENPEKYKAYNKEYMHDYNRGIRRRGA